MKIESIQNPITVSELQTKKTAVKVTPPSSEEVSPPRLPPVSADPGKSLSRMIERRSAHQLKRGLTLESQGNPKAAIRAYEKAQYMDPYDPAGSKSAHNVRMRMITEFKA